MENLTPSAHLETAPSSTFQFAPKPLWTLTVDPKRLDPVGAQADRQTLPLIGWDTLAIEPSSANLFRIQLHRLLKVHRLFESASAAEGQSQTPRTFVGRTRDVDAIWQLLSQVPWAWDWWLLSQMFAAKVFL